MCWKNFEEIFRIKNAKLNEFSYFDAGRRKICALMRVEMTHYQKCTQTRICDFVNKI